MNLARNARRKACTPALRWLIVSLAGALLCPISNARAGGIATDGSLGPRVTLTGPAYAIGANLGKQVGSNLFQSFLAFSLTQGESAVFSGPSSVVNIIGRITGPGASFIDGRLGSDIAGANLFLINPQGIAFGSHASLDLTGSFRVSTADYVRLADGSRFHAALGGDSVLTVAAPSAFGFVAAVPAAITLTGSRLRVADGATLALVGGSVVLKGAGNTGRLTALGGHVELMAAGPGETPIAAGSVAAPSYAGEVRLEDGMRVDASSAGGQVLIRAGSVSLDRSVITAHAVGAAVGGEIDVAATGSVALTASTLQSATDSPGAAGRIAIRAGKLVLVDSARIDTSTFGPGAGGTIDIEVGDLSLSSQSRISNSVQAGASGAGGQTSIHATGNVRLDGYGSFVQSNTFGTGPGGSVSIDAATVDVLGGSVQTVSAGSAPAGKVALRADELYVDLEGWIDASAYGTGPAGSIAIDAGSVFVAGQSALLATGDSGAGGRIAVRAASVGLIQGSLIDARAYGMGAAGSIAIDTGSLDVGSGSLVTATGDIGAAGSINVKAATVRLTGGGAILAGTYGDGRAGTVVIDARDEVSVTGMSASGEASDVWAGTGGDGDGGRIEISTGRLRVASDGRLSAEAVGNGRAGTIAITAQSLSLADGGDISTEAFYRSPGGGNITVNVAGPIDIVGRSEPRNPSPGSDRVSTGIFTYTGDVSIRAGSLSISDSGAVTARTWNDNRGGAITIDVGRLDLSDGGQINAESMGSSYYQGPSGSIVVNATEAITIHGDAGGRYSGIRAGTRSGGAGGRIEVTTPSLQIGKLGQINTATGVFGEGSAGNIVVHAGVVDLIGGGLLSSSNGYGAGGSIEVSASTRITFADGGYVSAYGEREGVPGRITLSAPEIFATAGLINTSTDATKPAGDITLRADRIELNAGTRIQSESSSGADAGAILIEARDHFRSNDSAVTTAAAYASGGNIVIRAPTVALTNESPVTATVFGGSGDGGNVTISATRLVALENSDLTARADQGYGGRITVNAEVFLRAPDVDLDASSNVIGNEGVVEVNAPLLDLTATITPLAANFREDTPLLRDPCGARVARGASSLVRVGRGGLPPDPASYLYATEPAVAVRPVAEARPGAEVGTAMSAALICADPRGY